jgi:uncharacterized protein (TIGR00251 family)
VAPRAYLSERDGTAIVRVRVQPRARRDEIAGERAGALLVRVTAPPVEGRANSALCRLLAKAAGIPAGGVEVVRGASGRDKLVRLRGLSAEDAAGRLG